MYFKFGKSFVRHTPVMLANITARSDKIVEFDIVRFFVVSQECLMCLIPCDKKSLVEVNPAVCEYCNVEKRVTHNFHPLLKITNCGLLR